MFSLRKPSIVALVAAASVVLALSCTASALANPTIELTRGTAEPVESIATQLGAVVTNGGGYDLFMHVKPMGGAGCGANPEADSGESVFAYENLTKETNPVALSRNWTFRSAGNYRVCAWVTNSPSESAAFAETTLQVRRPHLALSVTAPPTVAENQAFEVVTTAQAETERPVYEYVLRNTGSAMCSARTSSTKARKTRQGSRRQLRPTSSLLPRPASCQGSALGRAWRALSRASSRRRARSARSPTRRARASAVAACSP